MKRSRWRRGPPRIDPLSKSSWSELAADHMYAGHYDEAAAAYRKAFELASEDAGIQSQLCRVYVAQSRPVEALREAERVRRRWRLPATHWGGSGKRTRIWRSWPGSPARTRPC